MKTLTEVLSEAQKSVLDTVAEYAAEDWQPPADADLSQFDPSRFDVDR
jgi:hypothetical protein